MTAFEQKKKKKKKKKKEMVLGKTSYVKFCKLA